MGAVAPSPRRTYARVQGDLVTALPTAVITGTLRCARLYDRSDVPPFYARCMCGWSLGDRVSHRDETRKYQRHLRGVRASLR